MKKIKLTFFLLSILFLPILWVSAQGSDGSAVEQKPQPVADPITPPMQSSGTGTGTTTGTAPTEQPKVPATATTTGAATPTPRSIPPNNPVSSSNPTISSSTSTASTSTQDTVPNEDNSNVFLYTGLLVLATLPFGYLIAQSLKKKKTKEGKEEGKKCFDLKKLLDEKLNELTDLKGRLENKTKDIAKEAIHKAVEGNLVGDTLILIEKAEAEYERLKKLYEECTIEFGERVFKGTIIENSLNNTEILNKIKIDKTYNSSIWKLHDVFADEKQIPELQKHLADGPWYIHLWEQGKDDIKVVFKEKVFDIKFRDKSTWSDAVAFGRSKGIKEEQLDFKID